MSDGIAPRLRPLETHWVDQKGQPALLLQDRLGIAPTVVVPQALAPLLAFCDGTRTPASLGAALELHNGLRLDLATVERVLSQLDEALLLDNERFARAYQEALASYRSAPHRPASFAGNSYPTDPSELRERLDGWLAEAAAGRDGQGQSSRRPRGLICPHIDFERGNQAYARIWDRGREAVAESDLFIVLGTDHGGGPAELTLTRQSYSSPLGLLQTDVEAVEDVAEAVGDGAFRSELNHRVEHSIELAGIWLRHLAGDRPFRVVPVLCGTFHPFIVGARRLADDDRWRAGVEALRRLARRDRTMVIAAADLAHIGPAFGDPRPVGLAERGSLSAHDSEMLATVCRGDAEGFLDQQVRERDRRRVCGLPPIYLALSLLGGVEGEVVDYSQCPAPGGSVVSIAGVLLY